MAVDAILYIDADYRFDVQLKALRKKDQGSSPHDTTHKVKFNSRDDKDEAITAVLASRSVRVYTEDKPTTPLYVMKQETETGKLVLVV